MNVRWFARFSGLLLFLVFAGMVMGQGDTGTISGTVTDQSGAAIPGVGVTIKNVATGISRGLVTNELGRYDARALPAATYEVTGSLAGFNTIVRSGIAVAVGRNAVVDMALQIGEVGQSVTITAEQAAKAAAALSAYSVTITPAQAATVAAREADDDVPPEVEAARLQSEAAELLQDLLDRFAGRTTGAPLNAHSIDTAAKMLGESPLPAHIIGDYFELPALDLPNIGERTIGECPELAAIDPRRVTYTWKLKHGTKSGAYTLGTCAVRSKKLRQLEAQRDPLAVVPWWEVTIALDIWLTLTDEERARLVHHELMHCCGLLNEDGKYDEPKTRMHDIEEFAATLARFGAAPGESQIRVLKVAGSNPDIVARVQRWTPGPDDAPLFGLWTDTTTDKPRQL